MKRKKMLQTAAAGVLIALVWSLLYSLGSGGSLFFIEKPLRDLLREQTDEERQPYDEIKLIAIDSDSLAQLGQFPWDRALYAELIEQLAEAGAKAVFLDLVLAEPGKDEAGDQAMAAVMERYSNVVLPVVINFAARQQAAGSIDAESIDYPAETIGASREQLGHINVMQDKDKVVRMLTLGVPDEQGEMIPAASVRLANMLLGEQEQIRYDRTAGEWLRGDRRIPANARHQVETEFYSKPYEKMTADTGYDIQSFADVLTGDVPAEYYEGSIVLIGPYAPGLQDQYLTPLNTTLPMYGVEIQANMVQSLVAGKFFQEAGKPVNYSMIVLLTLLSIVLFERFKGGQASLAYGAIVILFVLVWIEAYQLFSYILMFTYSFMAMTIVFIRSIVINYIAEKRERDRVTNIFGRFVPRAVVDEMLASGEEVKVGGQRRDISVIFVDIRGFTPMSEKLEPEQVIRVLNEYLDICTKAVFKWNGTLDKFIGDGVMAIFGAPVTQPNHPELAVRAALEMKNHSQKLEERCMRQFGVPVRFGIGIHSGPAVVGNIGSDGLRLDYTAIGDTVNLAARLEANAKPGQVLISEETRQRVASSFVFQPMGEMMVKGKAQPVLVAEVIGEKGGDKG
ncbi:CHASE2 domain-containing protein [Paenibacillus sp. GCM10027626]|uniref:CHASE2 domain-containing protein n=1 Tax=Paenibacillus sp. GCM10027626 TaxID=3273411 RepID=UPI0036303FB3